MPQSIDVVVGGMWGSESKGRVTAALIEQILQNRPDAPVTCIRVAGPNAGHVVHAYAPVAGGSLPMKRYAMRQVPVGFVFPNVRLFIGPGSEIDPEVLAAEIDLLQADGFDITSRLFISPRATIIRPSHRESEAARGLIAKVGSTGKGVGAARADRIWRVASTAGDCEDIYALVPANQVIDLDREINGNATSGERIVIEGTQGYGLGLHTEFYPQCTSSDCRAIDFLAMSGISPWSAPAVGVTIHVVIRSFPIRVAGNSGPLPNETTWADLELPEERTTVTQKVRRVGRFDPQIVSDAVLANGFDRVQLHLAMADQLLPTIHGANAVDQIAPADLIQLCDFLQSIPFHWKTRSIGTSPISQIWLDYNQYYAMHEQAAVYRQAATVTPHPDSDEVDTVRTESNTEEAADV